MRASKHCGGAPTPTICAGCQGPAKGHQEPTNSRQPLPATQRRSPTSQMTKSPMLLPIFRSLNTLRNVVAKPHPQEYSAKCLLVLWAGMRAKRGAVFGPGCFKLLGNSASSSRSTQTWAARGMTDNQLSCDVEGGKSGCAHRGVLIQEPTRLPLPWIQHGARLTSWRLPCFFVVCVCPKTYHPTYAACFRRAAKSCHPRGGKNSPLVGVSSLGLRRNSVTPTWRDEAHLAMLLLGLLGPKIP